jgi:sucrose phosphorylase
MVTPDERIAEHLIAVYGEEEAACLLPLLRARLDEFSRRHPALRENVRPPEERLTQGDAILITYGDSISEPGVPPLRSLAEVLHDTIAGVITGVHILPFCPYSSDDGFSVIDYAAVDPALGAWEDVERLGDSFRLMFDLVINHISRHSAWFQAFVAGDPDFADAFIAVEPGIDLSQVVRPRTLPLLTAVQTADGEKQVWTTFSDDQMDLNYADPRTLLHMLDVLLLYAARGAEIIRLDAIAYLWKIIGTSCIHLEQTHRMVRLFRAVLDAVAPGVMLITETNVPHAENISYFGNGSDEAQMVYQFPLPPLALHAIARGDATYLTQWAAALEAPSPRTTFYNFTASHDGIGVRPVEGILPPDEVEILCQRVLAHGGHVSYRNNPDGSQSAYELNISYFDALSNPTSGEPLQRQVDRFMVSQAIMMALQGVPAVYVHSLYGSRSDHAGVARTGRYRSINREKLVRIDLETDLADPASLRSRVLGAYRSLLQARAAQPAFHPNATQEVLTLHPAVFALWRTIPAGGQSVLCLHNVSGDEVAVSLPLNLPDDAASLRDTITGMDYPLSQDGLALTLAPYGVLWLTASAPDVIQ